MSGSEIHTQFVAKTRGLEDDEDVNSLFFVCETCRAIVLAADFTAHGEWHDEETARTIAHLTTEEPER